MFSFVRKSMAFLLAMPSLTVDLAFADVNYGVEAVVGRAKQYAESGTILTASGNSNLYGLRFVSEFNRYLRADIGYIDFGEARQSQAKVQASTVQIGLVGALPITGGVSLTAKSGINLSSGSFSYLSYNNEPVYEDDASGSDPFFGLGISISLSKSTALSIGYDYNEMKWDDYENVVEYASVGWLWKFGGR
jgi:hypothetical protein